MLATHQVNLGIGALALETLVHSTYEAIRGKATENRNDLSRQSPCMTEVAEFCAELIDNYVPRCKFHALKALRFI